MSKVETLKASVEKAVIKVEKCRATIERHEKALAKKIATLEKVSGRTVDLKDIDSHKWIDGKSTDYYWEACDVSGKLSDIKGAKSKLKDAEIVLSNWEVKLKKEVEKDDFINNNIPQVIKDFLESWKQMAYDWHVKKYEAFIVFKKDLYEQEAKAIKECQGLPYKERRAYMKDKRLDDIDRRLLNFGGAVVVEMDRIRNEEERLTYLEKVLEEEKKRKAIDLINRINAVVREITDASELRVNEKGNLDGIIKGTKADAKIETIGAGGWNIQCWHYRTLVHELKSLA